MNALELTQEPLVYVDCTPTHSKDLIFTISIL